MLSMPFGQATSTILRNNAHNLFNSVEVKRSLSNFSKKNIRFSLLNGQRSKSRNSLQPQTVLKKKVFGMPVAFNHEIKLTIERNKFLDQQKSSTRSPITPKKFLHQSNKKERIDHTPNYKRDFRHSNEAPRPKSKNQNKKYQGSQGISERSNKKYPDFVQKIKLGPKISIKEKKNQKQFKIKGRKVKKMIQTFVNVDLNQLNNLNEEQKNQTNQKIERYTFQCSIGKGGFGKVWKVMDIYEGRFYALKQISKAKVFAKNSVEPIINQRTFLTQVRHPLIVKMIRAFQDNSNLYLLMPLIEGGDLRYHICKNPNFKQQQIKFIAACIILALQYLHKNSIIHRDVKPQNIVFDKHGYAHLTDLGIAKFACKDNHQETSGTPGYMAPEVLFSKNHSFQVDYYGLGVIIHQLMLKKRPFNSCVRNQLRQLMAKKQIVVKKKDALQYSTDMIDFVNKLILKQPNLRLGSRGIKQLKNHAWLSDVKWKEIQKGQMSSPFNRTCLYEQIRYKPSQYESQFLRNLHSNQNLLRLGIHQHQHIFDGYTCQEQNQHQQHPKRNNILNEQ